MNCNRTEVYLSEKFRMSCCGALDGCYKCPLSESNNGTELTCHNLEKENPKKAIEIAQNWSDKHQRMKGRILMFNKMFEEEINKISPEMQREIYKKVEYEYVSEDVKSFAQEHDIKLTDDEAEEAAYRYVYDCKYDCNLSYWQNIENVIFLVTDKR